MLDPGFTRRVLSNHPFLFVRVSVFKNLRDCSVDFPNFLHEVGTSSGYKSDRARFLKKKSLGVTNGEETLFGAFFVFCPYLKNGSNDFDVILHINSPR